MAVLLQRLEDDLCHSSLEGTARCSGGGNEYSEGTMALTAEESWEVLLEHCEILVMPRDEDGLDGLVERQPFVDDDAPPLIPDDAALVLHVEGRELFGLADGGRQLARIDVDGHEVDRSDGAGIFVLQPFAECVPAVRKRAKHHLNRLDVARQPRRAVLADAFDVPDVDVPPFSVDGGAHEHRQCPFDGDLVDIPWSALRRKETEQVLHQSSELGVGIGDASILVDSDAVENHEQFFLPGRNSLVIKVTHRDAPYGEGSVISGVAITQLTFEIAPSLSTQLLDDLKSVPVAITRSICDIMFAYRTSCEFHYVLVLACLRVSSVFESGGKATRRS
mmetsp:Transcript_14062/g.40094  ORF Transcript_14062/g.40094 Transcript_14062/m.40094 type:complete len:334 (-) Transcript_14062:11-1012(-)